MKVSGEVPDGCKNQCVVARVGQDCGEESLTPEEKAEDQAGRKQDRNSGNGMHEDEEKRNIANAQTRTEAVSFEVSLHAAAEKEFFEDGGEAGGGDQVEQEDLRVLP